MDIKTRLSSLKRKLSVQVPRGPCPGQSTPWHGGKRSPMSIVQRFKEFSLRCSGSHAEHAEMTQTVLPLLFAGNSSASVDESDQSWCRPDQEIFDFPRRAHTHCPK